MNFDWKSKSENCSNHIPTFGILLAWYQTFKSTMFVGLGLGTRGGPIQEEVEEVWLLIIITFIYVAPFETQLTKCFTLRTV